MSDRPPHFPDPDANPVAILEARIIELEEMNAAQYAELAWCKRRIEQLEAEVDVVG